MIPNLFHMMLSLPLEGWKGFCFFLGHTSHILFHEMPKQLMDSCCAMTCTFQSSSFVKFLSEWYSCCYAVEAIRKMNHNYFKGSLANFYVHDLVSYLHYYFRIAKSKAIFEVCTMESFMLQFCVC